MRLFESPSKAEHPSRKRSVFNRGGSGKNTFSFGSKKKLPPSSGGNKENNQKNSLFRAPSFKAGRKTAVNKPVESPSETSVSDRIALLRSHSSSSANSKPAWTKPQKSSTESILSSSSKPQQNSETLSVTSAETRSSALSSNSGVEGRLSQLDAQSGGVISRSKPVVTKPLQGSIEPSRPRPGKLKPSFNGALSVASAESINSALSNSSKSQVNEAWSATNGETRSTSIYSSDEGFGGVIVHRKQPKPVQLKPLFNGASSVASAESLNSASEAKTPKQSNPPRPQSNELRTQLKDLGANNKRCELLMGQISVLEEESARKDEKLRVMNDKLYDIQRGLSQIDEERSWLLQEVKALEEEKQRVQKQLDLREQECLTLVKRCSTQEERMRESTLLRCKNADLEEEVKDLRSNKVQRENDEEDLEATKQELKECRQKLEHTKKDHDAIANTLRNCLANIKKLTHEKQEWEDEKRRLINRAEVDIEKERLQHLEETNELKVALQSRQDKLEKLEEFMKDKSMTNLMLRKENAELNKWKTQTSVKMDECEKQIVELAEENKGVHLEIAKMSGSTDIWFTKLKEKEDLISSLEDEVSKFMSRAMSTSETVEFLEDENEELKAKVDELQRQVKSFDGWSQERDAMLQCLSVNQETVKELMEDVVALQLENDALEEEKQDLVEETKSKTESLANTRDIERDLSERELRWKLLEQNLRGKIALLEAEKTVMKESADEKQRAVQENIRSLEWTVASRTKDNMSLRQQLDEALETESDSLNQIKSLENNLSAATGQSSQHDDEVKALRDQTLALEEKLRDAQKDAEEAENARSQLETQLLAKDSELDDAEEYLKSLEAEMQSTTTQFEAKLADKVKDLAESDEALKSLEDNLSKSSIQAIEEASEENVILRSNNTALEAELGALQGSLRESADQILQLETDITEKEKDLSVASESLTAVKDDLRKTTKEFEECIADEETLFNQVTTLTSERDLVRQETKDLRICIDALKSKLSSRDREISEAREARSEEALLEVLTLRAEKGALEEQLSRKEEELCDVRKSCIGQEQGMQSLRSELSRKEEEFVEARKSCLEQEASMQSLRSELSRKEEELCEARKSCLQQEQGMQTLRSELQKAQTESILKDDEIRDLRLIELKDLEEEVAALEQKLKAKEVEISSLVGKLETTSLSQLDREHEVSEELSKLKTQIANLKREHREKEAEWLLNGQDTKELKANAITQKRRNQLLQKSLDQLRREKDMIESSESSANEGRKKLELALQREICQKEEKCKDLYDCRLTIDSLEKSLSTMSAQKIEVASLLDERTRLLSEMVEINKTLQASLNGLTESKEDAEKIRDERDELAEALSREQNIREVLEAEASTTHAQIATMKKEMKDKEKLKAENAELQAKIKRQEAFLKKKIQKEKVMRDRSSSANVFFTPAPQVSPRKSRSSLTARRVSPDATLAENLDPNISVISENEMY